MKIFDKTVTTDVLVVGAGFAGCFAAIRAREMGADVVVVEQGKTGFCGMSVAGTQTLRILHPEEDDLDIAVEGTVKECDYMADQEYVEVGTKETWDRFQDLLKFGIDFRRDDSGQIKWYYRQTRYPEFKKRFVLWEPMGTFQHTLKMKNEVLQRGARMLDRILVTDLLVSDGKTVGAVGFNTREGDFYLFKAKAVVLTNGYTRGRIAKQMTGDGIAMGLRAGAALRNMEFGRTPMMGWPIGRGGPVWVFAYTQPELADKTVITNARGEEFLEQYELLRKLPGRKYTGPPWHIHLRAVLKELKEGRGPCYVDYRQENLGDKLQEFWGGFHNKVNIRSIKSSGTTLDKVKYEIGLGPTYSGGGGIMVNVDGESSLPGLCAASVTSDMCGCSVYTIPTSIGGAMVTGYRSGGSAAKYALSQPQPVVDEEQAVKLKRKIYGPLSREQGTTADELSIKISEAWLDIDLKNETRLKKALKGLGKLEEVSQNLVAEDYHELVKCLKITNYLQCSQAIAASALERRESRLDHYREDYPLMDNKEWLKWVINRKVGDNLETYLEDIPIEKWKYRPEPTVIDMLRLKEEEAS